MDLEAIRATFQIVLGETDDLGVLRDGVADRLGIEAKWNIRATGAYQLAELLFSLDAKGPQDGNTAWAKTIAGAWISDSHNQEVDLLTCLLTVDKDDIGATHFEESIFEARRARLVAGVITPDLLIKTLNKRAQFIARARNLKKDFAYSDAQRLTAALHTNYVRGVSSDNGVALGESALRLLDDSHFSHQQRTELATLIAASGNFSDKTPVNAAIMALCNGRLQEDHTAALAGVCTGDENRKEFIQAIHSMPRDTAHEPFWRHLADYAITEQTAGELLPAIASRVDAGVNSVCFPQICRALAACITNGTRVDEMMLVDIATRVTDSIQRYWDTMTLDERNLQNVRQFLCLLSTRAKHPVNIARIMDWLHEVEAIQKKFAAESIVKSLLMQYPRAWEPWDLRKIAEERISHHNIRNDREVRITMNDIFEAILEFPKSKDPSPEAHMLQENALSVFAAAFAPNEATIWYLLAYRKEEGVRKYLLTWEAERMMRALSLLNAKAIATGEATPMVWDMKTSHFLYLFNHRLISGRTIADFAAAMMAHPDTFPIDEAAVVPWYAFACDSVRRDSPVYERAMRFLKDPAHHAHILRFAKDTPVRGDHAQLWIRFAQLATIVPDNLWVAPLLSKFSDMQEGSEYLATAPIAQALTGFFRSHTSDNTIASDCRHTIQTETVPALASIANQLLAGENLDIFQTDAAASVVELLGHLGKTYGMTIYSDSADSIMSAFILLEKADTSPILKRAAQDLLRQLHPRV